MKGTILYMVFIIFWAGILKAQTYHSITIGDATNDFSSTYEQMGTENGRTAYITWDASKFYIGITGNPIVNTSSSLYVVFDTDPVWDNDSRSGNGRSDQPTTDGGGATYPFNADVIYLFYQTTTNDATIQNPAPGDKYTVSSGSWSSSSISSGVRIRRHDTYITDLEIPWSDIGINAGDEFNVLVYVCNYFTGTHFAQWPTGNANGSAVTFKDFYSFKRESSINPNDGIYYSYRETIAGYSIGNNYYGSIFFVPSSSQTYYCNALIHMGRHLYIGPNATFSMGNNAADLVIDGNLCNKGTLEFSSNSSPGLIKVKGHFKNSGTITHHNVAMQFTGTAEQKFYGQASLYDVVLNNTGTSGGLTVYGHLSLSNNLTLTDGLLKIQPRAMVKVTGTLSVSSGSITIKSDTSGTGSLIQNTSGITATVERYVSGGNKYHFISSPISNATVSAILENYNAYKYDESNTSTSQDDGWTRVFAGNSMTAGQGYAVPYSNNTTLSFTGTLNTGTINLSGVTYTSSGNSNADGWNLIGNPYPSGLLRTTFVSANTNISGTLYFWDDPGTGASTYNRTADYAAINNSGAVAASSGSVGQAPNDTIAPGQGFFIKRLSTGSNTITFTPSMQVDKYAGPQFFVPSHNQIQRIYLACESDSGDYNETLIAFSEDATNGFDRLYDGIKLKGNPNLSFYSCMDNYHYCIQAMPLPIKPVVIPLGIDAGHSGTYSIALVSIENFDLAPEIYLEDRFENRFIRLKNGDSYNFSINAGIWNNRFYLHLVPAVSGKGENAAVKKNIAQILQWEDEIYVYYTESGSARFTITDMNGKVWLSREIQSGLPVKIPAGRLPGGIYMGAFVIEKSNFNHTKNLFKKIIIFEKN